MNHIKVNLPEDEDAYQSGNGEGVWVIVDDETKKLHDDDKENIIAKGILDNDSWYYQGLYAGVEISFELRGKNRPVVSYQWLRENYGEADKQAAIDYVLSQNKQ